MHYILSNPHNGAHVSHDGIELPPGHKLTLNERDAHALHARFGFLLLHTAPKAGKLGNVQPIKGTLEWQHENTGTQVLPLPDPVQHIVSSKAAPRARAPKKTSKK